MFNLHNNLNFNIQQQHRNPSNQIDLTTHSPYIPRPQRNPSPQIDIEDDDSEVLTLPQTQPQFQSYKSSLNTSS